MEYERLEDPEAGSTVAVGMSGGVDSTFVALMLKERGCNVIGVTMLTWDGDKNTLNTKSSSHPSCYGEGEYESISECRAFCKENNIDYYAIDVSSEYKKSVIDYVSSFYKNGITPNPCVMCNKFVKFGAMLDGLKSLGVNYDYFCTGHYAQIVKPKSPLWDTDKKSAMIMCAKDSTKDQAYFLYRVPSFVLEKTRFPLSMFSKKDVIKIARSKNLLSSKKAESQDFMAGEYFDVLFPNESHEGDIVDMEGKKLGKHKGIAHYTIGQRRGLGVSSKYPLYVHSIDAKENVIILSEKNALMRAGLLSTDWVWPGDIAPDRDFDAFVKIRFASPFIRSHISYKGGGTYQIDFSTPQMAIAPGQSAVLYDESGVIIGGGIIKSSF